MVRGGLVGSPRNDQNVDITLQSSTADIILMHFYHNTMRKESLYAPKKSLAGPQGDLIADGKEFKFCNRTSWFYTWLHHFLVDTWGKLTYIYASVSLAIK